jgi:hypothetical protein
MGRTSLGEAFSLLPHQFAVDFRSANSPDRVTPHSAGHISRLLCRTLRRNLSTKEKNAEDNMNMKRKLQIIITATIIISASAASVLAFSALAQPINNRSQFIDL